MYGSDSDADEDSENEGPSTPKQSNNNPKGGRNITGAGRAAQKAAQQQQQEKNAKRAETRIRADDDEPMDLLHAGAANAVGASSLSFWSCPLLSELS